METDETPKRTRVDWGRIIILSSIVGLVLGGGLWFWQTSTRSVKDERAENNNSDNRAVTETIKPALPGSDLPENNSQLELVGDKLSEVSFHLREQQIDAATQTLAEASQLALKSDDDPQLQQNLLNGIKQVRVDIENGKSSEAEQEISLLLNQLNMPEN